MARRINIRIIINGNTNKYPTVCTVANEPSSKLKFPKSKKNMMPVNFFLSIIYICGTLACTFQFRRNCSTALCSNWKSYLCKWWWCAVHHHTGYTMGRICTRYLIIQVIDQRNLCLLLIGIKFWTGEDIWLCGSTGWLSTCCKKDTKDAEWEEWEERLPNGLFLLAGELDKLAEWWLWGRWKIRMQCLSILRPYICQILW